jgi:hypothetical protein
MDEPADFLEDRNPGEPKKLTMAAQLKSPALVRFPPDPAIPVPLRGDFWTYVLDPDPAGKGLGANLPAAAHDDEHLDHLALSILVF